MRNVERNEEGEQEEIERERKKRKTKEPAQKTIIDRGSLAR